MNSSLWFSGAVPSTFHWPFGRAGRFDVVGVRRAGVRVSGGVGAVFTMCGVLFVRGARAWSVLGGVVRVVRAQEAGSRG